MDWIYKGLMRIGFIVIFIVIIAVWAFIGAQLDGYLLYTLHSRPDQIYLETPSASLILFVCMSLLLVVILIFLIVHLLRAWLVKEVKPVEKAQSGYRRSLFGIVQQLVVRYSPWILSVTVTMLLLALSLDSYIRIDPNHIYYSSFFTLGETKYSWKDDVAYVENTYTAERNSITLHYFIHLKNGDSLEINSDYFPGLDSADFKPLEEIATRYHIPLHKHQPTLE